MPLGEQLQLSESLCNKMSTLDLFIPKFLSGQERQRHTDMRGWDVCLLGPPKVESRKRLRSELNCRASLRVKQEAPGTPSSQTRD